MKMIDANKIFAYLEYLNLASVHLLAFSKDIPYRNENPEAKSI
jgi:hypothetical protein